MPDSVKRFAPGSVPTTDSALSEENVRNFCEGHIAHYKIPRLIRLVAEIPMTVTGKPQKFRMRQMMVDELGLDRGVPEQVDPPLASMSSRMTAHG